MKNLIFLTAIFFTSSIVAYASNDSIVVKNTLCWHSYLIDSNKVSRREVREILSNSISTRELIRQSKSKKTIGYICLTGSLVSSAFIINEAIKSKNETRRLPSSHSFAYAVSITSGVLALGIASLTISNRKFQRAITIYNSKKQSSFSDAQLDFNVGVNYLSLSYRF